MSLKSLTALARRIDEVVAEGDILSASTKTSITRLAEGLEAEVAKEDEKDGKKPAPAAGAKPTKPRTFLGIRVDD